MKTLYTIFIYIFISINIFSQKEIYVSYNKTTHLIFPTSIKYYSGIEELIILKKPLDNILSLKANVADFGSTNLSVATADGKYYSYNICYIDKNNKTAYNVSEDKIIEEQKVSVNMHNLLHIISSKPIKYIDYGSDWIEAEPIENIQNIVRVETLDSVSTNTNISIVDDDNNFYTFDISYNDKATNYNIVIGDKNGKAILSKEDLTDTSKEIILSKIKEHGRNIRTLGTRQNSVVFSVFNIFVFNNKLIFRFNLENNSNIKYDIDYLKFYVIDKKITKESALQEIEYIPLFLDNFQKIIQGKSDNTYSVCFEKFTIPDQKNFIIEINEKDGGRHIYFKIDNKMIEDAQML